MTRPKPHLHDVATSDVDEPERYLSDREIAARYGVSEATVPRWRREGKFPKAITLVPNGPNRTALSVILAHEASRNATSPSEAPSSTSFSSDSPYVGAGSGAQRVRRARRLRQL